MTIIRDKLSLYNDTLRLLGQTKLASVSEEREARYILDDVWEPAKRYCLEQHFWNFAQKTETLTAATGATPAAGYTYVVFKPDDWVRSMWLKAHARMTDEIDYLDEGQVWFTNYDPVVCRYLSIEPIVDGMEPAWPELFASTVAAYMAYLTAKQITGSASEREAMRELYERELNNAASKDVFNEPYMMLDPGGGHWNKSRRGWFRGEPR